MITDEVVFPAVFDDVSGLTVDGFDFFELGLSPVTVDEGVRGCGDF